MSEATIYKPSIYNGNGVYKNGAAGGGGGVDVDYKITTAEGNGVNFITHELINERSASSWRVYKENGFSVPVKKQGFEIEIKFYNLQNTGYNALFGAYSINHKSLSLQFINKNIAFIGVPGDNDTWQNWNDGTDTVDIGFSLQNNTLYKIKCLLDIENDKVFLSIDNNVIVNKSVSISSNNFANISAFTLNSNYDESPNRLTQSIIDLDSLTIWNE